MVDFTAAAQQQGYGSNPNWSNPFGSSTWSNPTDGSRPTVTQALSPAEQAILNSNQAIRGGVAGGLQAGMPSWLAAMQSPLGYGSIQNSLDFSGAPAMPQVNMDVLNNSIKARYGEGAQYLDPQMQQRETDLNSMLANQGIVRNPDANMNNPNNAWQREQTNFGNQRQKAYSDLMQNSITGGMEDLQKYFGMGLQARQQGVGEATAKGAFANQAQQQGFGQNVTQHTLPGQMIASLYGMSSPNIPSFQGTQQSPFVQAGGLQGQMDAANANRTTGLYSGALGGLASIFAANPGLLSSLPTSVRNAIMNGGYSFDPSMLPTGGMDPISMDTGQLTNWDPAQFDTGSWTGGFDVPSQDWGQWIPQG